MMELINSIMGSLFGLAVVGGLMAFMSRRDAVDWKKLEAAYGGDLPEPIARKLFCNMILYSAGRPAKAYKGIMSISLCKDGIGFRPSPLFAPFQRPIFVPYTDIKGWKQQWYIDAASTELAFRKTPDIRIIMPTDQVGWIQSVAADGFSVSQNAPAHGRWPWATFVTSIIFGVWAIAVAGFLLIRCFS